MTAVVDDGEMLPGNVLLEACQGCVLVHGEHPRIFGSSAVDSKAPQFGWNPKDQIFTVTNASWKFARFAYLTFSGVEVFDCDGCPFAKGVTRNDQGTEDWATTFVVVVPPRVALKLGRVDTTDPGADVFALPLARLARDSAPSPESPLSRPAREAEEGDEGGDFCFPLPAACGPYLCTQGVGGHLTHFFSESFHAIDLRCALGTPVLSIGRGVVKSISEKHCCGGIHVSHLTKWNALSIELDCGLVVDYVHTSAGSAFVRPGDRVEPGQALCRSGDIGFAPEPHLHIEMHRASDPEGPSVPLRFTANDNGTGATFLPQAGRWYSVQGEAGISCTSITTEATPFAKTATGKGRR